MKNLIIILSLTLSFSGAAQVKLDSLWAVWNNSDNADTTRLNAMHEICIDWYLYSQPDSAFYFAQIQYEFALEKGEKSAMASALNTQGTSANIRSEYAMSLDYYTRSLRISKELEDLKGIAASLGNIASVYFYQGDYVTTLEYLDSSVTILEEAGDSLWLSGSLSNIGTIYENQGDYDHALDYFNQSLNIKKQIGDEQGVAIILNNIGNVYENQGNYPQAMEHFTRSLTVKEEIGDSLGIVASLISFGNIYLTQDDYTKALAYYNRSLKISENIGDLNGATTSLNNIVLILKEQGEYAQALDLCNRSLKIGKETGDKRSEAFSLNNIGSIYRDQGDYTKAKDYFIQSLTIYKEVGDNPHIASSNVNIGENNFLKGNYAQARKNGEKALAIAQKINQVETIEASSKLLWKVNKTLGKYEKALEMYELHIATRDSVRSEENQRAIIRQEYKYAYEKQAVADSIKTAEANKVKDAKLLAEKAKTKQEQQQKYFLYISLVVTLLFGGIILNRFRVTTKQKLRNLELEKQISVEKLESASQNIREKLEIIEKLEGELESKVIGSERDGMERISTLLRERNYLDEPLWNEIIFHYDNVHNNYSKNILQKFNKITKADIKLLILVKMGFLNKEISAMRGTSIDATKKAKQRLRSKLEVDDLNKV